MPLVVEVDAFTVPLAVVWDAALAVVFAGDIGVVVPVIGRFEAVVVSVVGNGVVVAGAGAVVGGVVVVMAGIVSARPVVVSDSVLAVSVVFGLGDFVVLSVAIVDSVPVVDAVVGATTVAVVAVVLVAVVGAADVGEELVTTVVGDDVRSSTRVADVVPMATLPVSC